jgi:hypothetical protein
LICSAQSYLAPCAHIAKHFDQFPDRGACFHINPFGTVILHTNDKSARQVVRDGSVGDE